VFKPAKPELQSHVFDAIVWLNTCATQAMGEDPGMDRFPLAAPYGEPKVLVAENSAGRRFLLSVFGPDTIRRIRTPFYWSWPFSLVFQSRANPHPLVPFNRHIQFYRLSALNCGSDFNFTAAQIWKRLTGEEINLKELWLYILPHSNE
jgi:hypothetical protein